MYRKQEAYEYDIHKCNISVFLSLGLIDKALYDKLYKADRLERQIYIGKLRGANEGYTELYQNKVKEAVELFKKKNKLINKNIIEVAHDAVWVTHKVLKLDIDENIRFVCKRASTSNFSYGKVVFYIDSIMGTFFVRGITGDNIWFDKIKEFMMYAENDEQKRLYVTLHKFKKEYLENKLDKEFYKPLISNKDNKDFIEHLIRDLIK